MRSYNLVLALATMALSVNAIPLVGGGVGGKYSPSIPFHSANVENTRPAVNPPTSWKGPVATSMSRREEEDASPASFFKPFSSAPPSGAQTLPLPPFGPVSSVHDKKAIRNADFKQTTGDEQEDDMKGEITEDNTVPPQKKRMFNGPVLFNTDQSDGDCNCVEEMTGKVLEASEHIMVATENGVEELSNEEDCGKEEPSMATPEVPQAKTVAEESVKAGADEEQGCEEEKAHVELGGFVEMPEAKFGDQPSATNQMGKPTHKEPRKEEPEAKRVENDGA